jgi:predicted HicB family RNase H-like nuclease
MSKGSPIKTRGLNLRLRPEVREALEKAAIAEERSLAYITERALVIELRHLGYLPPAVKAPKR